MNRARQIRLDRGAGVVDTAAGSGLSPKTLNKIERGEDVTAQALARLAEFYGVAPSSLLMPAIQPSEEAAA